MPVVNRRVENVIRQILRLPPTLVQADLLDRPLLVRDGTIRSTVDYDDAWFFACARHAEVIFDVGANVGFTALLALLAQNAKLLLLVDAYPEALLVAV